MQYCHSSNCLSVHGGEIFTKSSTSSWLCWSYNLLIVSCDTASTYVDIVSVYEQKGLLRLYLPFCLCCHFLFMHFTSLKASLVFFPQCISRSGFTVSLARLVYLSLMKPSLYYIASELPGELLGAATPRRGSSVAVISPILWPCMTVAGYVNARKKVFFADKSLGLPSAWFLNRFTVSVTVFVSSWVHFYGADEIILICCHSRLK